MIEAEVGYLRGVGEGGMTKAAMETGKKCQEMQHWDTEWNQEGGETCDTKGRSSGGS